MEVRAVTEVLDEMGRADERRHPDPLRSLASHAREPDDVAHALGLHHRHHRMAADPAPDERAWIGAGAAVVGAPRAVERSPIHRERDAGALRGDQLVERTQPIGESGGQPGVQRSEQGVDVEGAVARYQQLAAFVAPADHARVMGTVVERALQQTLERRVLLLDHEHLVEAVGELARLCRVERHRHQQLEQANAGGAQVVFGGEAEHSQRLSNLVEGVPTRGDADPVVDGPGDDPIEPVVDAVPAGEWPADLLELAFHVDRVRREQPTVGMRAEWSTVDLDHRRRGTHSIGMHVDRPRPVRNSGHQLEAGPQPARARQRNGVATQVERLLHVAREEDRHVEVDHRRVARRRQRRGLGGRVVSDDGDDATVHRRAGEHRMTDRIAAAIEPRALAVPDAHDAVVAGIGQRHRQLAAHDGAGRQFFVDRRLHHDREVGHRGRGTPEFLGERADRRALIPRRERRSRQSQAAIEPELISGESGDGLDAGEEHRAVLEPEPIGELVLGRRRALVDARTVDRHVGSSRRDTSPCCTSSGVQGRAPRSGAGVAVRSVGMATRRTAGRLRASLGLVSAVGLMVAVTCAVVAAIVVYRDAIVTQGVRSTIENAAATDRAIDVTVRAPSVDVAEVTERLGAVALDAFRAGGLRGVAVVPGHRAVDRRPADPDSGSGRRHDHHQGWRRSSVTICGRWSPATCRWLERPMRRPRCRRSLHADAAALLGLDTGDLVRLDPSTAGPHRGARPASGRCHRPADPGDPRWFAQPFGRAGSTSSGSFTEVGPFFVPAVDFAQVGGDASYIARFAVDPDRVEPGDIDGGIVRSRPRRPRSPQRSRPIGCGSRRGSVTCSRHRHVRAFDDRRGRRCPAAGRGGGAVRAGGGGIGAVRRAAFGADPAALARDQQRSRCPDAVVEAAVIARRR